MLIEIGTDGNMLDEAKYSAELLSNALINLLKLSELLVMSNSFCYYVIKKERVDVNG